MARRIRHKIIKTPRESEGMTMGWQVRAACIGESPKRFIEYKEGNSQETSELKRTCESCPVQRACLEYAIANREPGWWGGMTARQRNRIITKRERQTVSNGTLRR